MNACPVKRSQFVQLLKAINIETSVNNVSKLAHRHAYNIQYLALVHVQSIQNSALNITGSREQRVGGKEQEDWEQEDREQRDREQRAESREQRDREQRDREQRDREQRDREQICCTYFFLDCSAGGDGCRRLLDLILQ